MPSYGDGTFTLTGNGGVQDISLLAGTTDATFNVTGKETTFIFNGLAGATLNINNEVAALDNYIVKTEGGDVTFTSSVLTADAIATLNVAIQGGSFSIGAALINDDVVKAASVQFTAAGGTENIGTAGDLVNIDLNTAFLPYNGLTPSDVINDESLGTPAMYTISGAGTTQTITITDSGGHTFTFDTNGLNFTDGTYTDLPYGPLNFTPDGVGGTDLTVCFLAGTHIRTPDGEVAVEALKVGDPLLTADGRTLPIRWIGVDTVSTAFSDAVRVAPVRVRAGSLGDSLPVRDLLVSPDHAMFLGGVLVQAGAIVNGVSITREANMPQTFNYYHIELEQHCLILAEGAATETFVDNVDRMSFDNWAEHRTLFGDTNAIVEMDYPRAKSARQVPSEVRATLAARQAHFAQALPTAA